MSVTSALLIGLWGGDFLRIPLPVTIACACVCSYVLGRYGLKWWRALQADSTEEPAEGASADDVVGHLKQLAESIRKELRDHEKALGEFQEKVVSLEENGLKVQSSDMASEAREILDTTRQLAGRVAHAYGEIRNQTDDLAALTNVHDDLLTGVQNRKALQMALKRMYAMRTRYGFCFSLLSLAVDESGKGEVDGVEQLREQEMLRNVASLVATTARDTDLVARWEGSQLMVLLPYATFEAATMFGNRLRENIATQLPLTVSVGVVAATDDSDPAILPQRCCEALHAAQATGPNTLFVHDGQTCHAEHRDNESREGVCLAVANNQVSET